MLANNIIVDMFKFSNSTTVQIILHMLVGYKAFAYKNVFDEQNKSLFQND